MIKLFIVAITLGSTAITVAAQEASTPPTAALAKKCRELAVKAYPAKRPGSPAGTGQEERAYFAQCIRKGGNMDDDNAKDNDNPKKGDQLK
jgi:hypothetical protein